MWQEKYPSSTQRTSRLCGLKRMDSNSEETTRDSYSMPRMMQAVIRAGRGKSQNSYVLLGNNSNNNLFNHQNSTEKKQICLYS